MRILYSLTFSAFCDDDKIKLKCKGEQTGKISILQLNSQPLEIRPSLHLHVGNKLLPDDGAKNQNWGTFWCAFIYLLNIISQISDLAYFHAEIQRDEIGAKWKIALLQKHSKSFLNINSLHKGQKWQQSRNCRESVAKLSFQRNFVESGTTLRAQFGVNIGSSVWSHLMIIIMTSLWWFVGNSVRGKGAVTTADHLLIFNILSQLNFFNNKTMLLRSVSGHDRLYFCNMPPCTEAF